MSDGTGLPARAGFRSSTRLPERLARLGLAIGLGGTHPVPVILRLALHPVRGLLRPTLPNVVVLLVVAVVFRWAEPALRRRRDHVRALLSERGVSVNGARGSDFVGVAEDNHRKHLGNGSDDVGFRALVSGSLTRHPTSGELGVHRDALAQRLSQWRSRDQRSARGG